MDDLWVGEVGAFDRDDTLAVAMAADRVTLDDPVCRSLGEDTVWVSKRLDEDEDSTDFGF